MEDRERREEWLRYGLDNLEIRSPCLPPFPRISELIIKLINLHELSFDIFLY
jgi:hypothetical protein